METEAVVRPYRPGDPSRVCYFYYDLYEKQYHFNGTVERYFLEGMIDLFRQADGSMLWVAEQGAEIVGSIAVIRRGEQEAQLRWFGVAPSLQGQGLGKKLIETAMDYCRAKEYEHLTLWTIDILKPARHLYGKYGFAMTETKPNLQWASYPLLEEKWEYHREKQ